VTRIVSGQWRGRRLAVPAGRGVRPTAERVREAWLSIVAPALAGARVLDLYAGTGALGLEALSRGAAHATFVERDPEAVAVLRQNITALGAEPVTAVQRGDALAYVARLGADAFDLALADPPFASGDAERLLAAWQATPFARRLAVEHDPRLTPACGETRRWGDIAVTFVEAP
jgi:16S rRNA (guanine966-N2)-methyltransferase